MLGDTDTLVTCFPCCLGTDNTSIRDIDTALPGDRCRDPGVAAPLSDLDITMVGTRSVLLLWAVRTPGDRAPSSPSDVRFCDNCYGELQRDFTCSGLASSLRTKLTWLTWSTITVVRTGGEGRERSKRERD